MAVTTRGIAAPEAPAAAPRAPAAKASSRAKAPSRSKASSKSKSASRTKSTSKAAPVAAEVPATPSPGTVTPDVIVETDVEALNTQATIRRLEREVARLRNERPRTDRAEAYRVRKSRSHKLHRRSRRYSPSSGESTDSEEGDRPPVSFLHHEEGTRPFFDLAARFPTIQMKYFKQIFYGTFQPENLTKLGQGMAD